jgi:hypothetical protein
VRNLLVVPSGAWGKLRAIENNEDVNNKGSEKQGIYKNGI